MRASVLETKVLRSDAVELQVIEVEFHGWEAISTPWRRRHGNSIRGSCSQRKET
jgi:hypothetical protein